MHNKLMDDFKNFSRNLRPILILLRVLRVDLFNDNKELVRIKDQFWFKGCNYFFLPRICVVFTIAFDDWASQ